MPNAFWIIAAALGGSFLTALIIQLSPFKKEPTAHPIREAEKALEGLKLVRGGRLHQVLKDIDAHIARAISHSKKCFPYPLPDCVERAEVVKILEGRGYKVETSAGYTIAIYLAPATPDDETLAQIQREKDAYWRKRLEGTKPDFTGYYGIV